MRLINSMPALVIACCLATVQMTAKAVDTWGSGSTTNTEPEAKDSLAAARGAIVRRNWNVALRELETVVQREPKNADAHNLLAYSLRNTGNYKRAQTHYEEALKLDPNHRGAHEYYGELYLKLSQPDNARKHLLELERICGKNCPEYKDLEAALASYSKAKK
jgi:Tfp pilus assembly protein PilF